MAESQSHGSCSSAQVADRNRALSDLKSLSQNQDLQLICSALGANANTHLVGGCVRDLLCGKSIDDIDLASALSASDVAAALTGNAIRVVETGLKHGTVTAVLGTHSYEITTFRLPGKISNPTPGPTIEVDLSARDFTINAIAYDISRQVIIDPYQGYEDLRAQLIRCVGAPEDRFNEDPLRVLRLVRFGPAAGRQVDPKSAEACAAFAPRLAEVSAERIRVELEKIVTSAHVQEAFRFMLKAKIIEQILPEMLPSVGFEQNDFHIHDVFEHTLSVMSRAPATARLRFSALFHDLGKPASLSVDEQGRRHFYKHEDISTGIAKQVMERLKFSNDESRAISAIVAYHMRPIECGPSGVRRLLRDLGNEFEDWKLFKRADATPTIPELHLQGKMEVFEAMVQKEHDRLKGSVFGKLAVNGDDLKSLGFAQGKALGQVLKQLEERVIENPDENERENLLAHARSALESVRNKTN